MPTYGGFHTAAWRQEEESRDVEMDFNTVRRQIQTAERGKFHAAFFADWASALAAVRAIIQSKPRLSMLRLSLPQETATNLAFAGHRRAIWALEQLLALRRIGAEKCMLLIGCSGNGRLVNGDMRANLVNDGKMRI